jgi:Leucine-rich repeat (LRR) protein
MAGVGVMLGLEELYLSQNGIKKMEDLTLLTKLTVLDLAHNAIEKVRTSADYSLCTDIVSEG